MKETELYLPLKKRFEELGFKIQAEVHHLDFMACKDDLCIGVELKLELNLKVIAQASKRLEVIDYMFIATLKPKRTNSMKDKLHIVKALGLGLLYVDVDNQKCDVIIDALTPHIKKKKKQLRLKKEFHMRVLSSNQAGSHQTKLMTQYKENLLVILGALKEGFHSAKHIQENYDIKNVQQKLYKNYYKWFIKYAHGLYTLTEEGLRVYVAQKDDIDTLMAHYKKKITT
jgi:hypothetical protein